MEEVWKVLKSEGNASSIHCIHVGNYQWIAKYKGKKRSRKIPAINLWPPHVCMYVYLHTHMHSYTHINETYIHTELQFIRKVLVLCSSCLSMMWALVHSSWFWASGALCFPIFRSEKGNPGLPTRLLIPAPAMTPIFLKIIDSEAQYAIYPWWTPFLPESPCHMAALLG